MKKLLPMLLFFLVPVVSFGQGSAVNDVAFKNLVTGIAPAAGATVTVCTSAGTGIPCTPLATVYSDIALTLPLTNPLTADSNGYYSFFAASGTYIVTVTGAGTSGRSITYTLPFTLSANNAFTGNNTHSGTETFTGLINCKNIGNVRCVDDSNTQGWTGSDIGGWINSAYTSCFPGTCSIKVYSATGNRVDFSTPIIFTTLDKNVNLECVTPGNSNGTGGLVLNYLPTTATTMMTIDNTKTTGIAWVPQEISGCTFVNNQSFVQGGPVSSSATGIASGLVNGGIGWLKLRNSAILGFSNGILMASSFGGWGMDCDNSTIGDSTIGISITGAQEVFHLTKCRLMSNGRGIKSTTSGDIVVVQTQFDSNTVLAVDLSTATGGMFSSIGNHYENFNTTNCNYVQSVLNNYFSGGTVLNDTATTNCNWHFNLSGAVSNVIDGVAIATAGQTATNVFQINDPACASFTIINNTPSVYTTLASVIGGSTTCNPVGTIITKGASNQKNPYYFSTGAQGAPGIAFFSDPLTGWARVAASTIQGVFGGGDGALFTASEVRHGSAGRFSFSSAADALNGAADTGISRDAAGVVDFGNGTQGNTTGITQAAAYRTATANPSTTGVARLASTDSIGWRNNANGADILLSKTGAVSGNIPADTLNELAFGATEVTKLIPGSTGGIVGTTTNDNANAGSVGEYVQSVLATGSSVTLATGVTSNVTSISLTAGDWDVTGAVDFTFGATTSYTNLIGSVSSTSATIGAQDSKFDFETPAAVPTAGADAVFSVPVVRFSLSGTTTVFLVAQGTFTVSTLKAYGTIRARRIR